MSFKTQYENVTRQENSADCGVWVIFHAHSWMINRSVATRMSTEDLRIQLVRRITDAYRTARTVRSGVNTPPSTHNRQGSGSGTPSRPAPHSTGQIKSPLQSSPHQGGQQMLSTQPARRMSIASNMSHQSTRSGSVGPPGSSPMDIDNRHRAGSIQRQSTPVQRQPTPQHITPPPAEPAHGSEIMIDGEKMRYDAKSKKYNKVRESQRRQGGR